MLPADLDLRAPGRADLGGLVALIGSCDATYRDWAPPGWQPPDADEERARWTARVSEPARWSRIAVEDGGRGRIVALVSWRPAESTPGVAHVGAVFVHPERWREGIAAGLLTSAEAAMLAGGFGRAELWTPDGAPAEALYRALGWRRDGRREWYGPLQLWVVGYGKDLRRAEVEA